MKYEWPKKILKKNATIKVVWHYLNQFDKWVAFSIRDLEKAIGLNSVTISHAIKILKEERLILYKSEHKVGTEFPGVFTVKTKPHEETIRETTIMSKNFQSYTPIGMILHFAFLENGNLIVAKQKEIAETIGVSEGAIYKTMQMFYKRNVVIKVKRGEYRFLGK